MFTAEDLQARFEQKTGMQLTPNASQTPAESSTQNQFNTNSTPDSGATPAPISGNLSATGGQFANQYKMSVADRLVPVEDDGSIRPSNMR